MPRPETPFEEVSYELNKFRERRLADRRFRPRDSIDRRVQQNGDQKNSGQDSNTSEPKKETN